MAQTLSRFWFSRSHPSLPPWSSTKDSDLERFRAFAQEHGQLTQQGMAEQWVAAVSDRTIGKALARIGFTRKKRVTAIANAMKSNGKRF